MGLNDPLANALSKIMNASTISRTECTMFPVNKVIKKVLEIMQDNGFLGSFTEIEDDKGNSLTVNLIGTINKCNVIKPSFTIKTDEFEKFEKRFLPARNVGIIIISTSKGIMTHTEAKKKNIGGKLLAYVY